MCGFKQVEKFLYLSEAISVPIIFFSHLEFLPRVGCERRSSSYMIVIPPIYFKGTISFLNNDVVAVWQTKSPPGPASRWFIERLKEIPVSDSVPV
jgi:hypothetical protein